MRQPVAEAPRIGRNCVWAPMQVAQRFRERAAHLRRLASTERDIPVRQELAAMALRFDQFAEELECDPSAPSDKPDSGEADSLR